MSSPMQQGRLGGGLSRSARVGVPDSPGEASGVGCRWRRAVASTATTSSRASAWARRQFADIRREATLAATAWFCNDSRVEQLQRSSTFFCSRSKKDSIAASPSARRLFLAADTEGRVGCRATEAGSRHHAMSYGCRAVPREPEMKQCGSHFIGGVHIGGMPAAIDPDECGSQLTGHPLNSVGVPRLIGGAGDH